MKKIVLFGLLIALAMGCASITSNGGSASRQKMKFITEPSGSIVSIGDANCKGPCEMIINRGPATGVNTVELLTVRVEKEGYKTCEFKGDPTDGNPWIWGNYLFCPVFFCAGAVAGLLIDMGTGAAGLWQPEESKAVLYQDKECEVFTLERKIWVPYINKQIARRDLASRDAKAELLKAQSKKTDEKSAKVENEFRCVATGSYTPPADCFKK